MAFELPLREGKPRKRGLTTMIDFGPDEMGWTGGGGGIESLLECAANYIDHAKIYAMNALLLPEEAVKKAAKLYRDYDCHPFAGGMLFEYAYAKNELDGLEALLKREELMGFEVSENYIILEDDERKALIERFLEPFDQRLPLVIFEYDVAVSYTHLTLPTILLV